MEISETWWEDYVRRLSAISSEAGALMQEYLDENLFDDDYAMIEYAYALATRYGEAAAALACEMYDSVADASGLFLPPAEPAPTATFEETAAAVRGTQKNRRNSVPDTVSRLTKQAAADTTLQNAQRDGAQFAWVPHGDTCAFCMMLASNGWQNMSRKALKNGHAEHIHAHCDCEYAVRFDDSTTIAGYDPDRYYDMYRSAEGSTWEEKVNSMRREQYARNKEYINAQKRAAYAEREKTKTGLQIASKKGIVKPAEQAIMQPAAWKESFGPEVWEENKRKAIWKDEWSSTYKKNEIANLYDVNGNRVLKKAGERYSVSFTDREINQMRDGVLTHNHPNNGCFSPEDINMLHSGALQEMRAVTTTGIFRMQQPESWAKEIRSLEQLRHAYYEIDNQASKPFFDQARAGKITYQEADLLGQEATVREFCSKYGIPFRFDSWESIRGEMNK